MGVSYQDIDVRLAMVEDKIDFIMNAFSVTKRVPSILAPGEYVAQTMTLKEAYQELKAAGVELEGK